MILIEVLVYYLDEFAIDFGKYLNEATIMNYSLLFITFKL